MKTNRKEFPLGTFIPTPQRVLTIIQLCLAFSLLLWYMTQPFLGEYFQLKSRMLMYEYVLGSSDFLKSPEQQDRLQNNGKRFALLEKEEQQSIQNRYLRLQNISTRPILTKIKEGIQTVLWKVPPFELAWIFFTIFTSILILKKVQNARRTAWLLPVIVLAFSLDNQISGKKFSPPSDLSLFPKEEVLVQKYIQAPLSSNLREQQKQLKIAWEDYLIDQWSQADSSYSHKERLEEAEFAFTLARINASPKEAEKGQNSFHEKSNSLLLGLYFLWNFLYAWRINKTTFPV